jgi:hypothetical protein
MGKTLAIAGLAIGTFAVLLQSWLTVPLRMANGHGFAEAVIFLLSFFTVLTNIAAVAVYAASLFPRRLSMLITMNRPVARACVAVCIAVVGLVYATVLAKIWAPEGLFWLCDALLHYVAPILYIVWWIGFGRDGTLKWADTPKFLAAPVIYLAYAIIRGSLTGTYPYPFIDVATLGAAKVAINCVLVAAVFLAGSLLAVALDRNLKSPLSAPRPV